MFNLKNMMYKMMIDCDKSTFYSNKSQYQNLNFIERIKLNAHLLACKPCSKYNSQNIIISNKIASLEKIDENGQGTNMRVEKKIEINQKVKENM